MLNKVHIEKATEADIPELLILVNSAYRGDTSRKGWTTEANFLEGIRVDAAGLSQQINNPDAVLLKARNDKDTIVGCVFLEKKGTALYLGMLTVRPDLQNAGMGKLLLEAAEKVAMEKGCTRIDMTVISIRQELIAWYERKGFKVTGEKQAFPDDPRFGIPKQPLEFVVMTKELHSESPAPSK